MKFSRFKCNRADCCGGETNFFGLKFDFKNCFVIQDNQITLRTVFIGPTFSRNSPYENSEDGDNSIYIHCIGVAAEISETDISKPGANKTHTISFLWFGEQSL